MNDVELGKLPDITEDMTEQERAAAEQEVLDRIAAHRSLTGLGPVSAENRFNPSQPRDDDGKWTDGVGIDTPQGNAMSHEAALVGTNPKYKSGGDGYRNNCQKCVPAYELRRRGQNVEALPYDGDSSRFSNVIGEARLWGVVEVDYKGYKVEVVKGMPKVVNKPNSELVAALKAYPEGARIQFSYTYKRKRYGHTIIVERVPKSTAFPLGMMFIDPQSGKVEKGMSLKDKTRFSLNRLDNKQIDERQLDKLVTTGGTV